MDEDDSLNDDDVSSSSEADDWQRALAEAKRLRSKKKLAAEQKKTILPTGDDKIVKASAWSGLLHSVKGGDVRLIKEALSQNSESATLNGLRDYVGPSKMNVARDDEGASCVAATSSDPRFHRPHVQC